MVVRRYEISLQHEKRNFVSVKRPYFSITEEPVLIISPGHNQNWIYDDVTQIFNMAPTPRDTI